MTCSGTGRFDSPAWTCRHDQGSFRSVPAFWNHGLFALGVVSRRGYFVQHRTHGYSSSIWSVWNFYALFSIVLIHEFGHQLACRSVGGKTHDIVLWPLGGVAYVSPPQRPGAQLWSIAAGPLVNVVLIPVLSVLASGELASRLVRHLSRRLRFLIHHVWNINWFTCSSSICCRFIRSMADKFCARCFGFSLAGRNSLLITSIIGFIGVALLILLAMFSFFAAPAAAIQLAAVTVFILLSCWGGLMHARALVKMAKAPRREGYACPNCKAAPPLGEFWICGKCGKTLDTFLTRFACPHCGAEFKAALCVDCGISSPVNEWVAAPASNEIP